MSSLVLVTGGTGTLGRLVVDRLRRCDHQVRVLSRHRHDDRDGVGHVLGDLVAGTGIDAAVAGTTTIVHCASDRTGDDTAAQHLVQAAAARPDPPHLVHVSIVGVDRLRWWYFRAKLAAEQAVVRSGLGWTVLRATQFYDLIARGAGTLGRLPVVPVPAGFRVRPVDPVDVAERLVELALGAPAGRVPDLGGPAEASFADLIRTYLKVTGRRRPVLPVPVPGLGAVRAGALLPDRGATVAAGRTWEEYLADRRD
ncbi:nucleotide-diphosphate-sugar epimerase [Actinocatenispora thailandica]|uniref:Nucleotide-diphosphate-sugar epimerase n=1 Tax=Actinocatenispora thailandica TaxID=227318 RepID=A0A7R7HYV1_9ACTN|nr:NAD(P)H-binding protein [Actinocatenispora thailandica]BCJ36921.1 nucleotide-diphosphate-sugar epimerase [Actinocatenispora thailandica]